MSALRDRSAPGVRLVLLPHERARGGEPLALGNRIISFSYEDNATKVDKLVLELDNFDLQLFEGDLAVGSVLEVAWGYPQAMAPPRRVIVRKLKGFQKLTIEGHATSVLMDRIAKTRAWSNVTRSDVVRRVAAEYGYEGAFVDVADTEDVHDTIHQTAETDARFVRRLAAREEHVFAVDDLGFHWRPRDHASAPARVLTWYSDPGRGDVISVDVETNLTRRVGRVEVRGRDPLAKSTIKGNANNTSVDRPTLGDEILVVDPESGEKSMQTRNAAATVHPTAVTSAGQAQRESDARFRRAEAGAVKLAMKVVGDPFLRAKRVVEVRGISGLLSGKYYVQEAKHSITASGFTVDLKLTRDGVGRRGEGSAATSGQAQGGRPNRNVPATGGALTEILAVDSESGTKRVEYRRDGRVIGAEDPEAQMSVAQ